MIYTVNQIRKIYSSYVMEYLDKGYLIRPSSSGYSGIVGYTDLIKPNTETVVRVWLSRSQEYMEYDVVHKFKISVKEYSNLLNSCWFDRGVTLKESKDFYEIATNLSYADSLDEIKSIHDKKLSRYGNKYVEVSYRILDPKKLPISVKDSIMMKVNSIHGARHAQDDCIKCVTRVKDSHVDGHINYRIRWSYKNKGGEIIYR